MTDSGETGPPAMRQPEPGDQHEQERAQRSEPKFGQEEAEAVAAAQDEAVGQGLLPPSRDESGPGND